MSRKKIGLPVTLPLKKYMDDTRYKYRQESLAFMLGVTPAFFSMVLRGIKPIPVESIERWVTTTADFYKLDRASAGKLLGLTKKQIEVTTKSPEVLA